MWGIFKLSTTLLAASNNNNLNSIRDTTTAVRELYDRLGVLPPVYKQASPPVKFSYVTPPTEGKDWFDDDVYYADSFMMMNNSTTTSTSTSKDKNDIFTEVSKKYGNEKPIALYLPGLDGYGISAIPQFNDLSNSFEFWRMSVTVDDRSSFGELVTYVAQFVDDITTGAVNRPIYVIGESFGGLLTPALALRMQRRQQRDGTPNPIKGLVLVNPATSFDESNWDVLAPALVTLDTLTRDESSENPSPYAILGSLTLSAALSSSDQLQTLVETIGSMASLRDTTKMQETIAGTLDSFQLTAEKLPSETLAHRISRWLMVGSSLVQSRLNTLDLPTLLVAGRDDRLLASRREVERLEKLLPQSEKLVVAGNGHVTLDDKVDLVEAMVYSKLNAFKGLRKRKYDPIVDWKLPSNEIIEKQYDGSVKPQEKAFSPIFISTDGDGNRHLGLDKLPREQPLLFVSNHQLLGVDLSMLVSNLLDNGIPVRGLAHPFLFQNSQQADELGGRIPGLRDLDGTGGVGPGNNFRMFGAVIVTPRNFYRLLQSGQNALLFPGGVREVFHGREEAYQLFWPEKVDFVRTAARFNATIVPLSSVGMADTLNILLEPSEVASLPIIGDRAKKFADNVTAARFDTESINESFLPPIIAPGLPSRNYFVFGKPFSTAELDRKDKPACETLYASIQAEINRGFDDVLRARKKDRFREALPRLAYERITGRKAPTFDIAEINGSI